MSEPRLTQSFPFRLDDKVTVTDINRPGIITGILAESMGIQYRVIYWNDCVRKTEWVYEWEVKLIPNDKDLPF